MDLTGHVTGIVAAAVDLANAAGPAWAGGQPHHAPTGAHAQEAVGDALARVTAASLDLGGDDVSDLLATGRQLWRVLSTAAAGDVAEAARLTNALLAAAPARPHLTQHGTQPWHLHFAPPGSSPGREWSAELVMAVATLLGGAELDRLRTCAAQDCDRVLLDETRSRTQRYCSTTCQNRTKVAAFRARNGRTTRPQ